MIVPAVLALVLVGVFAWALRLMRLERSTRQAWGECVATGQLLRSTATDLEKERASRRAALTLGRLMVTIILRLALAAVVPLLLMFGFDALGIASFATLEAALLSVPVIIFGSLLTLAVMLLR